MNERQREILNNSIKIKDTNIKLAKVLNEIKQGKSIEEIAAKNGVGKVKIQEGLENAIHIVSTHENKTFTLLDELKLKKVVLEDLLIDKNGVVSNSVLAQFNLIADLVWKIEKDHFTALK